MTLSVIASDELPFTDVSPNDWFYSEVCKVYSDELMIGTSDTTFSPYSNISIAQAITMAARAHNSYYGGAVLVNSITGNWYDSYVEYAIFNGIINSNDFSSYTDVATRVQMAYIFARVIPADKQETTSNIIPPDLKESDKYGKEVYLLYRTGILIGSDSAGTFWPDNSIIRSEAAVILLRVHLLLTTEPTPTLIKTPTFAEQVLELVNIERNQHGFSPLLWDDRLAAVAQAHSVDMVERNFFDHTNPDGLSPFDRMKNAGINYWYAAENIAAGQRTPEAVINAWMNSTGHRNNILSENLTHIGVGFYEYYWTQVFASYF